MIEIFEQAKALYVQSAGEAVVPLDTPDAVAKREELGSALTCLLHVFMVNYLGGDVYKKNHQGDDLEKLFAGAMSVVLTNLANTMRPVAQTTPTDFLTSFEHWMRLVTREACARGKSIALGRGQTISAELINGALRVKPFDFRDLMSKGDR